MRWTSRRGFLRLLSLLPTVGSQNRKDLCQCISLLVRSFGHTACSFTSWWPSEFNGKSVRLPRQCGGLEHIWDHGLLQGKNKTLSSNSVSWCKVARRCMLAKYVPVLVRHPASSNTVRITDNHFLMKACIKMSLNQTTKHLVLKDSVLIILVTISLVLAN